MIGNNCWKILFSDYLFDVFFEWGMVFLGVFIDNVLLFDCFEVLGVLVYFEENSERVLKD